MGFRERIGRVIFSGTPESELTEPPKIPGGVHAAGTESNSEIFTHMPTGELTEPSKMIFGGFDGARVGTRENIRPVFGGFGGAESGVSENISSPESCPVFASTAAGHPDPKDDDRRTCRQCGAWSVSGHCTIARPGGRVSAIRSYRPVPDIRRRCEGFMPLAGDLDQRHGGERWPGL